jgi:diguanylate cyclase (GGDEF)-like protein/PAS domain S-box-containing protein
MKLDWKNRLTLSLQVRVTGLVLTIFMAGIWLLSFYSHQVQREDAVKLLGEQQQAMAGYIAAEISEELKDRFATLEKVADIVGPVVKSDINLAQQQLEQLEVFQQLFNGGTFITDLQGTAVASVPVSANRLGINYIDRAHIANAIREGRTSIGEPVIGRALHSPVLGMAVPVRDRQGEISGALIGITDLGEPNFLDHMTKPAGGGNSYVLLVDAPSRTIMTNTNKTRIMERLPPPGKNWLIDKYLAGEEETGIVVNPHGVEVLASASHVDVADWYIVAAIPTAEAFSSLNERRRDLLLVTLLLTLLVGTLTWWGLNHQLHPIHRAARKLADFSVSDDAIHPLKITRYDEVGTLLDSFNRLMEVIAQREATLRNNEQKLTTILDNVNADIFLKDTEGRYLFANRHTREFFGKTMEEITGKTDEDFFDAASATQIRANDYDVLVNGRTVRTEESHLRTADGEPKTFLTVKLPLRDEAGNIYALCGISTDITDRKRMEDQMRHHAFYDALTRLPNRRLLHDRLDQMIAASKRSGLYCAVLFLDLDNFKPLNDTHGHQAGDLLLIEAGERLSECVREADTVARPGGDEFVIMLGELDADRNSAAIKARRVAEKILNSVSRPYRLTISTEDSSELMIEHVCSASIGICLFTGNALAAEDILNRADMAMYQVKQSGRNGIRFFEGT